MLDPFLLCNVSPVCVCNILGNPYIRMLLFVEIKSELGESDLPSAYDITDKFIMLPACPLSHQFFHKPANNQGTFSRNFIKCVQSQVK